MKYKNKRFWIYEALMLTVSVISILLNPALCFFGFKEYLNSHGMIWFAVWIIGFMTCARLGYAKAQHNYWVKVTFIVWGILWGLLFIPFAIYISFIKHDGFIALAILSGVFWQIVFTLIPLGVAIWYYKSKFYE